MSKLIQTTDRETPAIAADSQLQNPLHVGLDVRTWDMSGLGTYVRELLAAFARAQFPVRWTLIGPSAMRERLPVGLEISGWCEFEAPIYALSSFLRYPAPGPIDLFHYPHYNLPWVKARRLLVNVFDLFHLRYGSWSKRRYQSFFLRRLRWSRARLLTASDKTRSELEELCRIPHERLSIIALGAGRTPAGRDEGAPSPLRSLAGTPLAPPWLLATGIDQPHKNLDFLLSALGLYFQRRPDAPPLVWCGLSPAACERRGRRLPAHARQRIALAPYGDDRQIESLYRGALALLFPSLDEGFGLPPLEAMSRGVPVICARREPMTSILGDAPLYFEPSESASLWRMIDRLLDMPAIAEEVIARGRRCAARYDWDKTARETFALYQSLTAD